MRKILISVTISWIALAILSTCGNSELFPVDLKVSDVLINWQAGGARDHTEMVLKEIGQNPDYARIIARPTLKDRAYGTVSPYHGWGAYVGQDVMGSWKKGVSYLGGLY